MKASVICICCILLWSSDLPGQGKVLVVSRENSPNNLSWLRAAISTPYKGEIVTHSGLLPDSLETYDAIFTDLRFLGTDDSALVASELEKLTQFLLTKGKLYIEVSNETIFNTKGEFQKFSEYPAFRILSGIREFSISSIEILGVKSVNGAPGYFTEGLHILHHPYDRLEVNSPSVTFVYGNVEGILGVTAEMGATIGWQHDSGVQKVIIHWPIVMDHYNEFLGKVICNYFNLCEPLDVKYLSTETISVFFNPVKRSFAIADPGNYSTFELYNVLGVRIFSQTVGGSTITLAAELPQGNYIAVLRGRNAAVSKLITLRR